MSTAPPRPTGEAALRAAANLRGIGWLLLSVLSASAMAVAVRALSAEIDSRAIVLIRSVAICGALALAWPVVPALRRARFTRPWLHLARGVQLAVATHLAFYTLSQIPLATATVLFFTAPIFATLLSTLLLGERVGPRRWAAVAAGFLGAMVILRPGLTEVHPAMLAALASSALYGLALVQSRGIARADGSAAAFASMSVVTLVLSVPVAWPVMALPGSGAGWALLGVMVAGGAIRAVADIEAYRAAEAAVLAPVAYTRIVLVGVAGYVFFGEVVDPPTILGAAIIMGATLYIARREQQLRRRARAAAPPDP